MHIRLALSVPRQPYKWKIIVLLSSRMVPPRFIPSLPYFHMFKLNPYFDTHWVVILSSTSTWLKTQSPTPSLLLLNPHIRLVLFIFLLLNWQSAIYTPLKDMEVNFQSAFYLKEYKKNHLPPSINNSKIRKPECNLCSDRSWITISYPCTSITLDSASEK